jgi:hypothetical protein
MCDKIRDFITALAKTRRTRKEIKQFINAAYMDKALPISQINQIIKAVKEGKSHPICATQTP